MPISYSISPGRPLSVLQVLPFRGGFRRGFHPPASTLYTLHSTLYTLHSTLYTLHSTPYTLHQQLCCPCCLKRVEEHTYSHSTFSLITLAGFPATKHLAGTSRVTTLPAPTMAPSPMVTPFKMMALRPIQI